MLRELQLCLENNNWYQDTKRCLKWCKSNKSVNIFPKQIIEGQPPCHRPSYMHNCQNLLLSNYYWVRAKLWVVDTLLFQHLPSARWSSQVIVRWSGFHIWGSNNLSVVTITQRWPRVWVVTSSVSPDTRTIITCHTAPLELWTENK